MSQMMSYEAEASLVGSVLLDAELLTEVAAIVTPEDFASYDTRAIWGAIVNLAKDGHPVDFVTVGEQLDRIGIIDDVGGLSAVADMAKNTPSNSNARAYAEIVAELSRKRALHLLVGSLGDEVESSRDDSSELITRIQNMMEGLRGKNTSSLQRAMHQLDADFIQPLDDRYNGIVDSMGVSYGLRDLDALTMGMKPNELVVVGGRPSMGKTAFMMNTLRGVVVGDSPVLIQSLEMKRGALFSRLVAGLGNIPLEALRSPDKDNMSEYWSRISYPIKAINDSNLYINDETPRTIVQIRAEAKEIYDRHGKLGLVMIDYLGKVKIAGDYGSRHDRAIEEVVVGAKAIARDFNCPVMLLSQLNRSLESRPNKRPNMGDLKDSSAIEQEADTILFLYRDEVYNKDNPENKGLAEIIVGKQREGKTDTIKVVSRLSHARFEDIAPAHYGEDAA